MTDQEFSFGVQSSSTLKAELGILKPYIGKKGTKYGAVQLSNEKGLTMLTGSMEGLIRLQTSHIVTGNTTLLVPFATLYDWVSSVPEFSRVQFTLFETIKKRIEPAKTHYNFADGSYKFVVDEPEKEVEYSEWFLKCEVQNAKGKTTSKASILVSLEDYPLQPPPTQGDPVTIDFSFVQPYLKPLQAFCKSIAKQSYNTSDRIFFQVVSDKLKVFSLDSAHALIFTAPFHFLKDEQARFAPFSIMTNIANLPSLSDVAELSIYQNVVCASGKFITFWCARYADQQPDVTDFSLPSGKQTIEYDRNEFATAVNRASLMDDDPIIILYDSVIAADGTQGTTVTNLNKDVKLITLFKSEVIKPFLNMTSGDFTLQMDGFSTKAFFIPRIGNYVYVVMPLLLGDFAKGNSEAITPRLSELVEGVKVNV